MVQWLPAGNDDSPYKLTGENLPFTHFAKQGLALPPSDFFRDLLHFYKLKHFHLNPNWIIHISIFIHLCEAFLGFQPYFNLLCYLFRLKPQLDAKSPKLVGGVGFRLVIWDGMLCGCTSEAQAWPS